MPGGGCDTEPLLDEEGGEDIRLEVKWWLGHWNRGANGTNEFLGGGAVGNTEGRWVAIWDASSGHFGGSSFIAISWLKQSVGQVH